MSTIPFAIKPLTDFTIFGSTDRKPNPFRAGYGDTLVLLKEELAHLHATDVVLEIAIMAADIRQDGLPRAHAKVTHPGVRISFGSIHGPLSYATDMFEGHWTSDPPDWQTNLRAIALSLRALRAVDRYGVTKRGEQYAGWAALPPGRNAMAMGGMTKDQARAVLEEHADNITAPSLDDRKVWKLARAATHPDRTGDRAAWDLVEQAAKTLGLDG